MKLTCGDLTRRKIARQIVSRNKDQKLTILTKKAQKENTLMQMTSLWMTMVDPLLRRGSAGDPYLLMR
jgi:hypothetical protein